MSGFELLLAMRERDPDLAERVIFITGDTLSPTTREQLEQSGSLYLPKPFSINQLETALRQQLKRRSIGSNNR
jgi:two-component system NtrC family sensor kinase